MGKESMMYDINDIIIKCGTEVQNVILAYVQDEYAVEDVFQEACLKLYQNIGSFKNKSSVKTWFIRIAINKSKDYLKSAYHKRVVPVLEYDESDLVTDNVYKQIENRDDKQMLIGIIMDLPEKYRTIIEYVYYRDYSVVDTARKLNIAEGTARSRLKRAKDMIKNELEKVKSNYKSK